jgi:hypothetical protein
MGSPSPLAWPAKSPITHAVSSPGHFISRCLTAPMWRRPWPRRDGRRCCTTRITTTMSNGAGRYCSCAMANNRSSRSTGGVRSSPWRHSNTARIRTRRSCATASPRSTHISASAIVSAAAITGSHSRLRSSTTRRQCRPRRVRCSRLASRGCWMRSPRGRCWMGSSLVFSGAAAGFRPRRTCFVSRYGRRGHG